MFFMGVCRLIGRVLSVACGMYRYAFYRCVSVAWESAVGSLWNVSVCSYPILYSSRFYPLILYSTLLYSTLQYYTMLYYTILYPTLPSQPPKQSTHTHEKHTDTFHRLPKGIPQATVQTGIK